MISVTTVWQNFLALQILPEIGSFILNWLLPSLICDKVSEERDAV
jgi:hypothetical protein